MDKIPSHEQLLIFASLAELKSIKATSSKLNIPSSTISRKVSELEDMLSAKLLHRSTRNISLSNEGAFYLRQFSPIINEIQILQEFLNEPKEEPEGTLKISAPFSYGTAKLQPVFSRFISDFPNVKIQLTLNNEYQGLVAEGYDLAISLGPLKSSSLIAKKIDEIQYHCVASPSYINDRASIKTPSDLGGHDCIALSGQLSKKAWALNSPAGDLQIEIEPIFATNDPVYALGMALSGKGIAYLPDFLTYEPINNSALIDVIPGWQGRSRDLFAVYHHKHLMPLALKELLKRLDNIA